MAFAKCALCYEEIRQEIVKQAEAFVEDSQDLAIAFPTKIAEPWSSVTPSALNYKFDVYSLIPEDELASLILTLYKLKS